MFSTVTYFEIVANVPEGKSIAINARFWKALAFPGEVPVLT